MIAATCGPKREVLDTPEREARESINARLVRVRSSP